MSTPLASLPDLTIANPVIALEADGDFGPTDEENCPATTRLSNKQPVEINGGFFHVELLEVDDDGQAVNPSLQENVDAVWTLCGARPATIEIDGKNYVTVLFPHED
jgi:hypothetical protein